MQLESHIILESCQQVTYWFSRSFLCSRDLGAPAEAFDIIQSTVAYHNRARKLYSLHDNYYLSEIHDCAIFKSWDPCLGLQVKAKEKEIRILMVWVCLPILIFFLEDTYSTSCFWWKPLNRDCFPASRCKPAWRIMLLFQSLPLVGGEYNSILWIRRL